MHTEPGYITEKQATRARLRVRRLRVRQRRHRLGDHYRDVHIDR